MATIKTPDQRVRVFISSTLQELAPERMAAKEAILKLRLIPVLFESGARPHPPRDLYRSYLEQSHIFVGIYWNSYGWMAPDMDISGLEDEYRLSKDKTRLIYVKDSDARQPQLSQLLQDIQNSDSITYQKFSTATELRELLENDLAFLLSDHFENDKPVTAKSTKSTSFKPLPFLRTALIGREKELLHIRKEVLQPDTGLITLMGAGGTGKTRLALELAHLIEPEFADGVCFVALTTITDAEQVPNTIAHELGLLDTGHQHIEETIIQFLRDKNVLLIVDNFEHVIAGSPIISNILANCPQIKIIVTSRTPLQLREEKIIAVTPLAIEEDMPTETSSLSPCARLFIDRASDINPTLSLSAENIQAINTICRKLDGLPLAIELAAARSRLLNPVALLSRMGQALDLLSQGPRDLPQRHQTMRAAIDWSYKLLDDEARRLLRQVSVFTNGWTLDAATYIANQQEIHGDVLDLTEKLLNVGLISVMEHSASDASEPRFTMLQTVKEYALGLLESNGEHAITKDQHCTFFFQFLEQVQPEILEHDPVGSVKRIDAEYQNIISAFDHANATKRSNVMWSMLGNMHMYWMARGRFSEFYRWKDIMAVSHDMPPPDETVLPHHFANGLFTAGAITFLSGRYQESQLICRRCLELFTQLGLHKEIARVNLYLGATGISLRDHSALQHLHEAMKLGTTYKDDLSFITATAFLGEVYTDLYDFERAAEYLRLSEAQARQSPHLALLAVTLVQWANYYMMSDQYDQAIQSGLEAMELFDRSTHRSIRGWGLGALGQSYLRKGDLQNSKVRFMQCLVHGREAGDKSMLIYALLGFSGIALEIQQPQVAAMLLSSTDQLRAITGYGMWSTGRKLFGELQEKLTATLGEDQFTALKDQGREMPIEKIIALAQEIELP